MEQTLRIPTSGPVMALMGQFSTGGKQGWRQAGLGLNPDSALPPPPTPCLVMEWLVSALLGARCGSRG